MNDSLQRYWLLLADYIRPQRARFILLVILLLSSIGLQIINPQIVRYFIDTAVLGNNNNNTYLRSNSNNRTAPSSLGNSDISTGWIVVGSKGDPLP